MNPDVISVRVSGSGVLALSAVEGRQRGLKDGDALTMIDLGDGSFLLVKMPRTQMTLDQIQKGFGKALAQAGYTSREKVTELVKEVKREMADERQARRTKKRA